MSECEHTPPVDRTRGYATMHRKGPGGERHELRIGTDKYNGKPFAAIRLWCEDEHGGMWPSPRSGCTIRRHELVETIEALTRIARDLGELPASGKPEPPASSWRGYGAPSEPREDARVDHAASHAGQGRRRVDLGEACRSAAFDALVPRKEGK